MSDHHHIVLGQDAAERKVNDACHRVRDYFLRIRRHHRETQHRLNDSAIPHNDSLRATLIRIDKQRIASYRAIHLESRKTGVTSSTIERFGSSEANKINLIACDNVPVWYLGSSLTVISDVKSYSGGTYSIERPQSAGRTWSKQIVVTNPPGSSLTHHEMGQVWIDYITDHSQWQIDDTNRSTSVLLTITGNGNLGDVRTFEIIARNDIGPSRLQVTVRVIR